MISKEEKDKVLCFAYKVLNVLRIGHYDIILSTESSDDDDHACMMPIKGRYTGVLFLNKEWEAKSIDEKKIVLIHECIHLLEGQVYSALGLILDEIEGVEKRTALDLQMMLAIEYMTDTLTSIIQEAYDINWPTRTEVEKFVANKRKILS